jgi:transketolase C-terminal domain/subunit
MTTRMASDLALALVLSLAGLASAGLVGLALVALLRRRSWSYLLVALALATLLARTVVAVGAMTGSIDTATHHTLEHGLDVAMAGLVIAAVVTARNARGSPPTRDRFEPAGHSDPGGEDGD